jgi:hypothetical protein
MEGFIKIISKLAETAGIDDASIYTRQSLELPGYFRPTKKWDVLIVAQGKLLAVVEAKSQVGPSFGNNFNNRSEEAIGSAVDFWTAYRDGVFKDSPRPWLGYLFLLEGCEGSTSAVGVQEPHFSVMADFRDASYQVRYEILLRKLIRERHYDAAAYLMTDRESGLKGNYSEPAVDLSFKRFANAIAGHLRGTL